MKPFSLIRPASLDEARAAVTAAPEHVLRAGGVDGLSGATLTARSVTAAVRRVLALHAQKLAQKSTSRSTSTR